MGGVGGRLPLTSLTFSLVQVFFFFLNLAWSKLPSSTILLEKSWRLIGRQPPSDIYLRSQEIAGREEHLFLNIAFELRCSEAAGLAASQQTRRTQPEAPCVCVQILPDNVVHSVLFELQN